MVLVKESSQVFTHLSHSWVHFNSSICSSKETAQLITPSCSSQSVGQFLWQHLQRDLDVLSRALGCSVDNAALTVHLALQRMISLNGGKTGTRFKINVKNAFWLTGKLLFDELPYYRGWVALLSTKSCFRNRKFLLLPCLQDLAINII